MEVKVTKDYSVFKFLGQNRSLTTKKSQNHIKELSESINKNGFIKPVIVNDRMEVIDGQHRIEAAKAIGAEVIYIKVKNAKDNLISQLNTHQLNWGIQEYLHYYVEKGNKDYIKAQEFVDLYEFPVAETVNLLKGARGGSSGRRNKEFKAGTFKVNKNAVDWAYTVADEVQEIREYDELYKPFRNSARFVSALVNFCSFPEYNHRRMMQKLSKMRTRFVQCASKSEYIDMFEGIYNYGMKRNILRTREV